MLPSTSFNIFGTSSIEGTVMTSSYSDSFLLTLINSVSVIEHASRMCSVILDAYGWVASMTRSYPSVFIVLAMPSTPPQLPTSTFTSLHTSAPYSVATLAVTSNSLHEESHSVSLLPSVVPENINILHITSASRQQVPSQGRWSYHRMHICA